MNCLLSKLSTLSLSCLLVVVGAAGCSFDTTAGEGTCDEPGTERGEFVCTTDGWRKAESVDAGADGTTVGDVAGGDDGAADGGGVEDVEGPQDGTAGEAGTDAGGCDPTTESCPCDYDGTSRGVCSEGELASDGEECLPPDAYVQEETGETCDGRDNDCDGTVDEACKCDDGATRSCYTGSGETRGVGACESGTQTCTDGTWGECNGETLPADEEVCGNGEDNDCDGVVGENCPCDYLGESTGVCGEATADDQGNCPAPDDFMETTQDERPNCDGKDNDCDGVADEGCECSPGDERSCYTGPSNTEGEGICESGTQVCGQDNTWGDCVGETTPEPEEVCGNGADDDCDGSIDEGCSCNYDGKSAGVCKDQPTTDSGCKEPAEYEQRESSCSDGLDNDCDGDPDGTDEDCNRRAGDSCSADDQCLAAACVNGTCPHRVFVTSTGWEGDMGGLTGMDGNCGSVAAAAGLGGDWKAVASDANTAAKDRLRVVGPVYNLAGQRVADGKQDLWDESIANPVQYDEFGRSLDTAVWTSTNADGTSDGANEAGNGQQCNNWRSDDWRETAEVGLSWTSDYRWIITGNNSDCSEVRALYCIDGQNP